MGEPTTAAEARARLLGAATDQVIKSVQNNCELLGLTIPDMIEVGAMALSFIAARHAFVGDERKAIAFLVGHVEEKAERVAQAVTLERATKNGRAS